MELRELEKLTVNELRELAHKYDDVKGAIGMKKAQLVDIICQKMGIAKKAAPPKGMGKKALKEKLEGLRKRRDAALTSHDPAALKRTRTLMRRAKHRIRDIVEKANRGKAKTKEGAAPAAPAS